MRTDQTRESVEVTILGQKYTIKGDAPEEYIKSLAAFIDGKMKDVCGAIPSITPLKAAILVSLNIADELHKLREAQDSATRTIEEKADALTGLFD